MTARGMRRTSSTISSWSPTWISPRRSASPPLTTCHTVLCYGRSRQYMHWQSPPTTCHLQPFPLPPNRSPRARRCPIPSLEDRARKSRARFTSNLRPRERRNRQIAKTVPAQAQTASDAPLAVLSKVDFERRGHSPPGSRLAAALCWCAAVCFCFHAADRNRAHVRRNNAFPTWVSRERTTAGCSLAGSELRLRARGASR
jgi:hypothetical protein